MNEKYKNGIKMNNFKRIERRFEKQLSNLLNVSSFGEYVSSAHWAIMKSFFVEEIVTQQAKHKEEILEWKGHKLETDMWWFNPFQKGRAKQIIITRGLYGFLVEVNGGDEICFKDFDDVINYLNTLVTKKERIFS